MPITLEEIEVWSRLPDNTLYEVSTMGRLKSIGRPDSHGGIVWREKILKQNFDKDGYVRVSIKIGKNHKTKKVHRLVAQAFIPNPENRPQVNHKNFDKSDNRVENLEWNTAKENNNHLIQSGRRKPSKRNKLSKDKAYEIRRLLQGSDLTFREIGAMFNVSISAVNHVKSERCWKPSDIHQVALELKCDTTTIGDIAFICRSTKSN